MLVSYIASIKELIHLLYRGIMIWFPIEMPYPMHPEPQYTNLQRISPSNQVYGLDGRLATTNVSCL